MAVNQSLRIVAVGGTQSELTEAWTETKSDFGSPLDFLQSRNQASRRWCLGTAPNWVLSSSGLLFLLYILSSNSLHAIGMELDVIAVEVIGGTLLTGGRAYVVGSLLGVLLLAFVVVQRFATRRPS